MTLLRDFMRPKGDLLVHLAIPFAFLLLLAFGLGVGVAMALVSSPPPPANTLYVTVGQSSEPTFADPCGLEAVICPGE